MITKTHYFGTKPYPFDHGHNAALLLGRVNAFLWDCAELGYYHYEIDPDTEIMISGSKDGSGDGGYRLASSKTGARRSKHKFGHGIDICDTKRLLAAFCISKLGRELMQKHNLYMENPRWTPVWCHLQDVHPLSRMRVYRPSMRAPLTRPLPDLDKVGYKND